MSELVSLVVLSKKALQQAEATCSTINRVSRRSSDLVTDILATEAKIKWLSEGVLEQLDLAMTAVHAIQNQRAVLQSRAAKWDTERNHRAQALDLILETLAQQLVPPSLHQVASASSLFGSQHSGSPQDPTAVGEGNAKDTAGTGFLRTVEEIRKLKDSQTLNDRSRWKTLRDFVDERGIDEAADSMDTDRAALESHLATTASHSDSILKIMASIRSNLPSVSDGTLAILPLSSTSPASPPPTPARAAQVKPSASILQMIGTLLTQQDNLGAAMARDLEGLATHYDQITSALRDYGSGMPEPESSPTYIVGSAETYKPGPIVPGFSMSPPAEGHIHAMGVDVPPRPHQDRQLAEEDMQVFTRDTEELPSILADIEEAAGQVNEVHARLQGMQDTLNSSLAKFEGLVDSLDILADTIAAKLQDQHRVETESYAMHENLDAHLSLFDELSQTYVAFHTAYQKLLLEMDRRRRSRDSMEELIHDVMERLEQMRDDELVLREQFFAEQGHFLPDDLCPFVGDQPARWALDTIGDETLPDLQESVLADARGHVLRADDIPAPGLLA